MHVESLEITIGALMGLTYTAAPGPVNVATLRVGVCRGWRSALPMQIGAGIGDIFWAVLAFAGLSVLVLVPPVHLVLGVAGTAMLLYLGWSALREGVQTLRSRTSRTPQVSCPVDIGKLDRRAFGTGLCIAVGNPFAVAFWLSAGGAVLHQYGSTPQMFLTGFCLGVAAWALGLPLAIALTQSVLQGRVQGWIYSACGLALIVFGCSLGHTLLLA